MAFNRNKFKATSLTELTEQNQETQEVLGRNNNRVKYKKMEPGKNRLRIYPAHPDTRSFMYPRTVHFLPIEVEEWDDVKKEKTGKMVVKRKPIFSAKVHLQLPMENGQVKIAKCPADEYVTRALQWCHDNIQDEKERKKKILTVTGQKGIKGSTKWISYADFHTRQTKEFCKVELATSVQILMNKIAAGQDDEEGVLCTDPYTDPDTGRLLFVTYDPEAGKKNISDYYSVSIDLNKNSPLADEDLERLMKEPSLESLFVNSYRKKDFDMMIEGLKRFDEENEFGIFEDPDYINVVEEISQYKFASDDNEDTDEEDSSEKKPSIGQQKKAEVIEDKIKDSDLPFDMSLEEMDRNMLVGYIRRNQLNIRILPRYTDEDIVTIIKEEEEINNQNTTAQEEQDVSDKEESPVKKSRGGGGRGRLNKLAE